ncbi:hypothetical protein SO802_032971 [Lithocarpus litseifolius]|uniref:Uncharacterized protein n=1 Tax=Lithocarpus litseifolius TaxID=425828 RepID=A0AAW2BBP7_9ROSI
MIAFIEGGIRIPIGIVTRDYLMAHRLASTQCTLNMFRILRSVDALNKRMGLNLTHNDVNWVDNLHHLTGQGSCLKSRYPEVRLIQCLPNSNKGLKKDFLIISGEWHDGLPYKNTVIPNFNLVNQESLDKILKAKAPKCVIKARDPRLHRISVAAPGFLLSDPVLEGTLTTEPILEGIPKVAPLPQYTTGEATSSHPTIIKGEEEKEEEVVEVSDSKDEFEVFNRPLSPESSTGNLELPSPAQSSYNQEAPNISGDMRVQRKLRSTLQELLESQPGGNAPGKAA